MGGDRTKPVLLELPRARPREEVLQAIANFVERCEHEGFISVAMCAVCADGGIVSNFGIGLNASRWELVGSIENLKLRVLREG